MLANEVAVNGVMLLTITPSGAAPGLTVLALLHFIRLPYGPVSMEHPCSSATFRPRPAGSPGRLTRSALRMPAPMRPQPAHQLQCVLSERALCLMH